MGSLLLYGVSLAFIGGVFTRSLVSLNLENIGLIFVIAIAFLGAWYIRKGEKRNIFLAVSVALIFFGFGAIRFHISETTPSAFLSHLGNKISMEGRIAREPEFRDKTTHIYVKPTGFDEFVLVIADKFSIEDAAYGDIVRVDGVLKIPEPFETDGGRVFDYPGYLKARGVEMTIPFARVEVLSSEDNSLVGSLYQAKHMFMRSIELMIPEPESGLGEGILLGVKRALGKELEQTFRETGIIHIVVLSGYNVMIIVSTLMYLLTFFFFPKTRLIIGIIAILIFAILVGFSPTVIRASGMAILLLIAQTTGRTYEVLRALLLTGVIMLIVNPYLLVYDPGFQLSFLATLGLILLSPHIEKRLVRIPEIIGVRGFVTATLATQIMVLPLLLYHTGLFSVVSIFVNVLVLPMVPLAMLLTFLTGILGVVSQSLGLILGFLAHLSLSYIILIPEFFGRLPFASFSLPVFPFWLTALTYGLLSLGIMWLLRRESEKRVTSPINDYEGWVIEEEKENSPEARSASGELKSELPFR